MRKSLHLTSRSGSVEVSEGTGLQPNRTARMDTSHAVALDNCICYDRVMTTSHAIEGTPANAEHRTPRADALRPTREASHPVPRTTRLYSATFTRHPRPRAGSRVGRGQGAGRRGGWSTAPALALPAGVEQGAGGQGGSEGAGAQTRQAVPG